MGASCKRLLVWAVLMLDACGSGDSESTPSPEASTGVETGSQTWTLAGFAVGVRAGNHPESDGAMVMPDLLTLPNGRTRLYYNQVAPPPIYSNILVAESDDGLHWTPLGVALAGAHDDADRMRILGGPSVVRLPDGRYRMFTRCSSWVTQGTPDYHIRSAISTDGGLTFADEGVRIDNRNHDPSSPWRTVAHGRVYALADGTWAGVFTVEDEVGSPGDLALFTSPDCEQWTYVRKLYLDWHDPVVVRRGGGYCMVAYYTRDHVGLMTSSDGLQWPAEFTRLEYSDPSGVRDSGGSPPGAISADEYSVGDHGALVRADGSLLIYANFKAPGDVASSIAIFQSGP